MPDHSAPASGFQYSLANLKPVESDKIAVTFPDGAKREFPKGTTGLDIAKGISPSLASLHLSTARCLVRGVLKSSNAFSPLLRLSSFSFSPRRPPELV